MTEEIVALKSWWLFVASFLKDLIPFRPAVYNVSGEK